MSREEQIAAVEAKMKQYYKMLLETRQSRIDGIYTGLCIALEAMGVSGERITELINEAKDERSSAIIDDFKNGN